MTDPNALGLCIVTTLFHQEEAIGSHTVTTQLIKIDDLPANFHDRRYMIFSSRFERGGATPVTKVADWEKFPTDDAEAVRSAISIHDQLKEAIQ